MFELMQATANPTHGNRLQGVEPMRVETMKGIEQLAANSPDEQTQESLHGSRLRGAEPMHAAALSNLIAPTFHV